MKRKIAAILAADAAEYSRLVAEDEEGTLRQLMVCVGIFRASIEAHGGRVFNTAGDAVLAEFQSAVEAVRSAIDIQHLVQEFNEDFAPRRRMMFRMGLSIGDVVDLEGDLLGDGVNIAARLQTLAEPGGLAISKWVQEQIAGKVPTAFRDAGQQHVRNIPAPIHVFKAIIAKPTRAPEPRRAAAGDERPDAAPAEASAAGTARADAWRLAALAAAATVVVLGLAFGAFTLMRPGPAAVTIREAAPSIQQQDAAPIAATLRPSPELTPQDKPASASHEPGLVPKAGESVAERPGFVPSAGQPGFVPSAVQPGATPPAVEVPLGLQAPGSPAPRDPISAAVGRETPGQQQAPSEAERLREAALPPPVAPAPEPSTTPAAPVLDSAAPTTQPGEPAQATVSPAAPVPDSSAPAPQATEPAQAAVSPTAPTPDNAAPAPAQAAVSPAAPASDSSAPATQPAEPAQAAVPPVAPTPDNAATSGQPSAPAQAALPTPPAAKQPGAVLSTPATPQPNRQREAVQSPPPASPRQDAASDRKRQRVRCAEIIERAQLGDLTSDDQAFLRSKCR